MKNWCDWQMLVRRSHLGRAILWVAMIPFSIYYGWAESLPFITFLSLWALVEGSLSSYFAEKAKEAAQDNGN